LLVCNSVVLTLAWLLWLLVHQFVTINLPVSLTNGLLLPEVIRPEDIMFE